jgi:hypothetical protein
MLKVYLKKKKENDCYEWVSSEKTLRERGDQLSEFVTFLGVWSWVKESIGRSQTRIHTEDNDLCHCQGGAHPGKNEPFSWFKKVVSWVSPLLQAQYCVLRTQQWTSLRPLSPPRACFPMWKGTSRLTGSVDIV